MTVVQAGMRITVAAGIATAVAASTACSMQGKRADSEYDLSVVRGSLVWGSTSSAEAALERVEREVELSPAGRVQAQLLRAEIALRNDQPARAMQLAESALGDDRFRPAALEVQGKAAIRQGDFPLALAKLTEAEVNYASTEDAARAKDLRLLAEGLVAYAGGSPADARLAWSEISDDTIRRSLDIQLAKQAGSASRVAAGSQ